MSRPLAPSKSENNSTPPPDASSRGQKNLHSPWSAPRSRKKRPNIKVEPAPLAIIDEDYASPPKRRNGGTSPAARELRLSKAGLEPQETRIEEAGPLAQGLLQQTAPCSVDGFSPLAFGLVRSSFAAGAGTSAFAPFSQQEGAAAQAAVHDAAPVAAARAPIARQVQGSGVEAEEGASAGPLELAECSYSMLSRAWTAPLVGAAAPEHPRPMSQMTDRSRRSHAEMDTDMRSSWGSERSADVPSWREMQVRLHDEFVLLQSARRHSHDQPDAAEHHDAMRASTDSLRDSLEMPSCTERQNSIIPLRTSIKGHWQQSHLPSPSQAADAKLSHKLPSMQSPSLQRPPGSAQKHKGTCFLCPSPFCKPPRDIEAEAEVVRRTESEEFVLHRTQSFNGLQGAAPRKRPSGKPRRKSLNRPPSPTEQELVHRQDGFSAKCGPTPGHLLSPQSEYSEDEDACLGDYPLDDQAPSSQELLDSLRDQSKNPTIDELNDMLRTFCTLDFNPKDAEELVHEACKTCQLAPNATTLRTLDKIWAAHEQMYG